MSEQPRDVDGSGEGEAPDEQTDRQSASEAADAFYFIAANGGFEDGEVETFSGPAQTLTLSADPDPDSVTVFRADYEPVGVKVEGREVRRAEGHFGRGRWTVTYQA